jgi:vitamin B12 transporter
MIRPARLALATLLVCAASSAFAEAEGSPGDESAPEHAAHTGIDEIDETVVVTATRTARSIDRVGSTITVIDAADLELHQDRLVIDALERVPGVSVRRDGDRLGSRPSIFIRGADSDQTLVLVDGVRLQDPSAPNREAFLDHLGVEEIERIEVLSGPQSVLYGSDSLGGVINIITKKGEGPPNGRIRFEGGTFATLDTAASLRGGGEGFHYGVSVGLTESDGFSSSSTGDPDDDGYERTNASIRGGLGDEALGVDASFRFLDARTEIDGFGAPASDTSQYALALSPHLQLFDGLWEQRLTYSFHRAERENGVGPDTRYESALHWLDWQNTLRWDDCLATVIGVQYDRETARFDAFAPAFAVDSDMAAVYADQQIALGNHVDLTGGVRVEHHDRFGAHVTGRFTGVVRIPWIEGALHGSVGSGFKAPTLAQLFDDSFGSANPDLDPEQSLGWDIGYRQRIGGRISFDVTGFWNDIDDLIVGDPNNAFRNENIDSARTRGLQLDLEAGLLDGLRWIGDLSTRLGYTLLDARAQKAAAFGLMDGDRLLRRPKHEVSASFVWRPADRLETTLDVRYVGDRFDIDPIAFTRVRVDSYVRVDLAARIRVSDRFELYGRTVNVANEDYEDVAGFQTSDRAWYGGFRFDF